MASKAGEVEGKAGEEAGENAGVEAGDEAGEKAEKKEVVEAKVNSLWHLANIRHLTSVELKDFLSPSSLFP